MHVAQHGGGDDSSRRVTAGGRAGCQPAGSGISGRESVSSLDRDAMNIIDISETPAYVPMRNASTTHHAETIILFPPELRRP